MAERDGKVSGFFENGLGVAMIAAVAAMLTEGLGVRGHAGDIADTFVGAALRIACLLMVLQCAFEAFGREAVLLRNDWQRFGAGIMGVAVIACGAAVMTAAIGVVSANV